MTTNSHYGKTHSELWLRRSELSEKRAQLEVEMNDLQNEIAHLDGALAHLSPLAGFTEGPGDITGLGITDAIRAILSEKDERMAPSDVFRKLKDKGFNFSGYSSPMASIYKILTRLREAEEIEVETENRKIFYRWKNRGPEISDEDIPF
jgi:hypothetical protein